MEKVLIKYTTIPQHLYINRSADEQLKQIIDEMQRPGYVLVARQMGKTNLLLNAKRTLENDKRIFTYIDLSNLYESEVECYRYIIDSIIEAKMNIFSVVSKDIQLIRDGSIPPHQEYVRSLRKLLSVYEGDLVIILDEIDALRSISYSDNIFAQIRSNYFQRTNYVEFERLTYILSGVIDPIELIKDRNKSPFNIGEKIYLNDFNKEEFEQFIIKSNLKINQEVSDEIYRWTNGNPRLTFDISSEVENVMIQNKSISKSDVQEIIRNKYLITYDVAPIDHIRDLIKQDKIARQAILNIYRRRFGELSDEVKKRLYLYGIISSNFENIVEIKNLILKYSLSEEWIKSIDLQSKNTLNYALEKIDMSEFSEAIQLLLEYLNKAEPKKAELEICYYNLGYAYYSIHNFSEAIDYFEKDYSANGYIDNAKCFLGICKIAIGQRDEGIEILESIVIKKTNSFAYRNAVLNLAIQFSVNNKQKSINLLEELIAKTYDDDKDSSIDELNNLRATAHYYIAEVYYSEDNIDKANYHINNAIQCANTADSLYLNYYKYLYLNDKEYDLCEIIISNIVEGKIKFNNIPNYSINFCEQHLLLYLEFVSNNGTNEQFETLLKYSTNELFLGKFNKYEIVYNAWNIKKDENSNLVQYIMNSKNDIDVEIRFKIYRDLLIIYYKSNKGNFIKLFEQYHNLFMENKSIEVVLDDIYFYVGATKYKYDRREIDVAIEWCDFFEKMLFESACDNIKLEGVIISYWLTILYNENSNNEKTREYADKTIDVINETRESKRSLLTDEAIKNIKEQVVSIKNKIYYNYLAIVDKQYDRNEKVKVQYKDGRIIIDKFKRIKEDILLEKCKVI